MNAYSLNRDDSGSGDNLRPGSQENRDTIENLTRQLADARDKIRTMDRLSTLGTLIAGVAHEIKNPLNYITNYAETSTVLLHKLLAILSPAIDQLDQESKTRIGKLSKDLVENLSVILRQGDRADHTISSMLGLARGNTGEVKIEDLYVLLEETVRIAFHSYKLSNPGFNASFTVHKPQVPILEPVIRGELARALLNIYTNAFYAVHKKAQQTTEYKPAVTTRLHTDQSKTFIEIHDNGIGIPDVVYKQLFQPFVSDKPSGVGTGLGLSIVKEIIENSHRGSISVDTHFGDYTTFTICLPANSEQRKAP